MIYNTSSQLKGPFRFTVARLLSSSFFVYLTFSLLRVYQGPSSARPPQPMISRRWEQTPGLLVG